MDVQEIVYDHERWIGTDGASGKRANFRGLDLSEATVFWRDLSESDLQGATGLPEIEAFPIDKAIAEAVETAGALDMEYWHSDCGTAHCRAGWTCVLHPQGRELEETYGTSVAAAFIYNACSSLDRTPDWHASNEAALESIRKAAAP